MLNIKLQIVEQFTHKCAQHHLIKEAKKTKTKAKTQNKNATQNKTL